MSLTKKQYESLVESVVAAKGAGSCQYVIDGKPGCVIGQYASRCGVSIKSLKAWDAKDENGIIAVLARKDFSAPVSQHGLLVSLQDRWDDTYQNVQKNTSDARLCMLFMIEAAR